MIAQNFLHSAILFPPCLEKPNGVLGAPHARDEGGVGRGEAALQEEVRGRRVAGGHPGGHRHQVRLRQVRALEVGVDIPVVPGDVDHRHDVHAHRQVFLLLLLERDGDGRAAPGREGEKRLKERSSLACRAQNVKLEQAGQCLRDFTIFIKTRFRIAGKANAMQVSFESQEHCLLKRTNHTN